MEVQIKGDQWNNWFRTVQVYWKSLKTGTPKETRGLGALARALSRGLLRLPLDMESLLSS